MPIPSRAAAALSVSLLFAAPVAAQSLGRIEFPNSGDSAAQAPFIRGVLLLHSFEYEDAARAFREAQAADSGFALAYWGEAMTHTHPLWDEQDLAAGRAALMKLGPDSATRLARAGTTRERAYLETTEVLYFADAPKPKRDTLTAEAFERIMREVPWDDEARAFYALWLMGLSQGTRNVPTYMRAGALAEEIYRRHPEHPGALHYIIHAFDDPVHAPLGLHAAQEYAKIVPDADHAQHMTTHIFLALGMWPETVRQNAIAAGPDSGNWRPGHYTSWMDYGLLQMGRIEAARGHFELMRRNIDQSATPGRQGYLLSMRAHYLVLSQRWSDDLATAALEAPRAGPVPRAMDAFALGYAALERGDRQGAEGRLRALKDIAARLERDTSYAFNRRVPAVMAAELDGLLLWSRGKREEALRRIRAVSKEEDAFPSEFGPPDIVKPSHELLGELLLEAGRPGEAAREFARALELAPGRSPALLGLARAARAAGDDDTADRALSRLAENWKGADPGLPGLAEIERLRAAR